MYRFNNQQINYREKNYFSFVQNKIKTMDYQKYEEHCQSTNKMFGIEVIEVGIHDSLDLAIEKVTMLNENPEKFGHTKLIIYPIIMIVQ